MDFDFYPRDMSFLKSENDAFQNEHEVTTGNDNAHETILKI